MIISNFHEKLNIKLLLVHNSDTTTFGSHFNQFVWDYGIQALRKKKKFLNEINETQH